MPIYEFRCPSCGHRFERLQKMDAPDPEACPSCGAAPVQRQVSAPQFRLAGSGWYETDFKRGSEAKRHLAGDTGSDAGPASGTKGAKAPS